MPLNNSGPAISGVVTDDDDVKERQQIAIIILILNIIILEIGRILKKKIYYENSYILRSDIIIQGLTLS